MNNAGMDGYTLIDDELDTSVEPVLNWIVTFFDDSELDYWQVTETEMKYTVDRSPAAVSYRRMP
jgi:hypothetical protein